MDNKRIADIGEVHWHDGLPYFLFGQSDNGFIFKDEEAYKNDWNAPCYVPEYAAEDAAVTINGVEYECGGEDCDYYTHNDLLELCCDNREWCDALFNSLDWCYPETRIYEEDDEDTAYHYRFIKPGAKVWWHDPAGETSDVYVVYEVHFSFDERGELTEGRNEFSLDAIVKIASPYSEAEVYVHELTPVYPDLIKSSNMRFQNYEFNGTTYKCRIVTDKDGNDLVIASTKFLDALQPGRFDDENEGFGSKEAEDIYDEIFFFTDESSLRLTDEQLVEVLKEDNEEWFN